tara:strand:+ start:37 stop:756 length:720 start_codon:yes stop_codon:yes gene_type:complete
MSNQKATNQVKEIGGEPLKGKAKRQAKRANIKRVAEKYDITRGQARRGLRKMNKAGESYVSQDYLSSLKMVKNNSSTPFKMKHQSPLNEVINSSGSNPEEFKARYRDSVAGTIKDPKLAGFIKDMHVIDNPEYASYTKKLNPDSEVFGKYDLESEPARSSEYDFFVKHRTDESDALAYRMMNLNEEVNSARMNKDSDKVRELMDKQKNMRKVIKNAGRVMEEGGKSEYLEDKMNFRGEL